LRTYVRLRVASEVYAIPVENVLEVAAMGEVTALPGSPAEVLGVRSLRGHILPVIDLGLLLGSPGGAPPARLLVAEAGGRQAGFAIDEVSDVGGLPDPTEETDSSFLRGGLLDGDELVGVIDVPAVFDSLERADR
jgi:purine-binding chemotaxis protein CheW